MPYQRRVIDKREYVLIGRKLLTANGVDYSRKAEYLNNVAYVHSERDLANGVRIHVMLKHLVVDNVVYKKL